MAKKLLLLSTAFDETFELVDKRHTGFAGQFLVDGKWYFPKFGCDSLQRFMDILRESSQENPSK